MSRRLKIVYVKHAFTHLSSCCVVLKVGGELFKWEDGSSWAFQKATNFTALKMTKTQWSRNTVNICQVGLWASFLLLSF